MAQRSSPRVYNGADDSAPPQRQEDGDSSSLQTIRLCRTRSSETLVFSSALRPAVT